MAKNKTDIVVRLRAENERLHRGLAKSRAEMKKTQMGFQKMGNQISTSLLTAFGGAAVIGAVGKGVGVMKDFEFQMSKVSAISGATADEMKQLEKNARSVGAASSFTATQIGQLQEEFARLGFSVQQITEMTDATRKLALVADTELGETAKAVGASINAFGLSAAESTRVVNVMAESFSKSALNLEKYEVAMSFAAASGKAFGLNIEQVTSMIGVLIDNGIQASKAGAGLRDIFSDLTKSGMTLEQALTEVTTSENKLKTALDLVGKTSANQLVILSENTEKVRELTGELSDTNQELERMASIMEDNLQTDLDKLKSAWEELWLSMGGQGVMREFTQDWTAMMNRISGASETVEGVEGEIARLQKRLDTAKASGHGTGDLESRIDELTAKLIRLKAEAAGTFAGPAIPDPFNITLPGPGDDPTLKRINARAKMGRTPLTPTGDAKTGGLLNDPLSQIELQRKALTAELKEVKGEVNEQLMAINDMIRSSAVEAMASFVGTFTETGSLKKAFASLMDVIANGMAQFGKLLIAQGVAVNAFKKSLATLQGGPAIAAGVALIAAAGAVKGFAGSLASGGGGGGYGGGGGFQHSGGQQIHLSGEFRARGQDLALVLDRHSATTNRRQSG